MNLTNERVSLPIAPVAALCTWVWVAAFAVGPARAELGAELRNWGSGPSRHLFTPAEAATWEKLTTDKEATEFVQLFWAQRDPDPTTPQNEFLEEFRRRVAFGDQRFAREGVRGSMTRLGQVFIVLGPPSRVRSPGSQGTLVGGDLGVGEAPASSDGSIPSGGGPGRFGTGAATDRLGVAATETWFYEDERVPAVLKRKRFDVAFRSKPGTDELDLWDSNEALTAMAEVAASYVLRPDLTLSDLAPEAPALGPRAWRAQPVSDEALVSELERAGAAGIGGDVEAAAFRASDGTWIVPVQVSTTDDVTAVDSPRLVGVVKDAAGGRALTFAIAEPWQEAGGQRYVQETLLLPPGEYQLTAGVADASGKVSWAGDEAVTVPADDGEFWISDLILGHDVHVLRQAQQMLEPFAWQGIAVVPRSGEKFRAGDDLWLYLHACNASLDADGKPRLQVIAQLTGPMGFRGPLAVEPSFVGSGCWVVAPALDASAFAPGAYAMKLQVTDAGAGKTLTSERSFTITE